MPYKFYCRLLQGGIAIPYLATFTYHQLIYQKKFIFSGNIIGGKRHMKVVKAMNIIGPISSVIIVIIVMVAPLATKGRR